MYKIKAPLRKALCLIAKRYPEPTKENTAHPNTHRLLDIRDKFFELEDNKGRKELFEAAFRILICEYEHDPYYRERFDWGVEEIIKSGWQPRPLKHPHFCWREKGEYGGKSLETFFHEYSMNKDR